MKIQITEDFEGELDHHHDLGGDLVKALTIKRSSHRKDTTESRLKHEAMRQMYEHSEVERKFVYGKLLKHIEAVLGADPASGPVEFTPAPKQSKAARKASRNKRKR